MNASDILDLIQRGESSLVQFKEQVNDAYKIATEMVAFSNSSGGTLIIGVNDKTGNVVGLTYQEIQETNSLLVNAATDNVKSPITIFTETVPVEGKYLLVARIREGSDKPYKDNKGVVWIKNGSDKRKVTSNEEFARLLQSSGNLFADEMVVGKSSLDDLDREVFKKCLFRKYHEKLLSIGLNLPEYSKLSLGEVFDRLELNLPLPQLLVNMGLMHGDHLTLAGLLLFAKDPQGYRPMYNIQCASFLGNEVAGSGFRDKENVDGNFLDMYERAIGFLNRNLRKIQVGEEFNVQGVLEVPLVVLVELLINAMVHRDYFIHSSIKLFIFDNRIEIISPGRLPNTLTIENIKSGISVARNPILHSITQFVLPYSGLGSGIPRALSSYEHIEFQNDKQGDRFFVIINRIHNL